MTMTSERRSPPLSVRTRSIVMARGPNFVYGIEFILTHHGEAVWKEVLQRLDPDDAEILAFPLLITTRQPFALFKRMVETLAGVIGDRSDDETALMYEYIADQSLNRIYKLFFRFANPSFVIGNYPLLWKRFFDSGKVTVPVAERGHAVVVFDLPEIFLDWLPPACLGYSRKAVAMAGGTDLTMREERRLQRPNGNWEIVYDLSWQEEGGSRRP